MTHFELRDSETHRSIPWENFPQPYKRHWDAGDIGPALYSDRSAAEQAARIYDAQMGHRKGQTVVRELRS